MTLPIVSSKRGVRHALSLLRHIVWPAFCPLCGRVCRDVCAECLAALVEPGCAFCMQCGADEPCLAHAGGPYVRSATAYGAHSREIVHRMKYAGARGIAYAAGEVMGRILPRPEADILVPVPLHKQSRRDYNQAERIASGLASVWRIPVRPLLRWRRALPRQVERGQGGRALPEDAIMTAGDCTQNMVVCLVDDVYTTGSTLNAARRAVERAGCVVSGAAVWSRSVLRR